jgi:isoquinoline 1-oxidoreductase alpha subunit
MAAPAIALELSSMLSLHINGETHDHDVEPETPMLWVLRDEIGLTGTKFGCGIAQCGACTIHVDGVATRSCQFQAGDAVGKAIVTIEGLGAERLHPVQTAWIEKDVPQCGYCQSGQIMAVASLLAYNPSPTDAEIDDEITNICRCGTYPRIRAAIHRAAALAKL